MTATTPLSAAPPQTSGPPPQPKKARKNPQRRKSEQAKAQAAKVADSTQPVPFEARPVAHRAETAPPPAAAHTRNQAEKTTARPNVARAKSDQRQQQSKVRPTAIRSQHPANERVHSAALAPAAVVTGGLLGCVASAAVIASAAIWRDYAGADSAVLAAKTAKLCLDNLADDVIASLKAGTYSNDEALDILRRTTLAYASTIPGGAAYVERIFREISLLRKSRGADVDKVLKESYAELALAARKGAPADEMRSLSVKQLNRLAGCAGTSVREVVDRNPDLRPYRDGAAKAMQGSPAPKIPTVKLEVTMRRSKTG